MEAWERDRAVPRELWKKMGEQGYLCPWLPEAYGGLDLDFSYSVIIGEELIRADGFGVGVPLHSDVAVPYIFSYGSEEGKGFKYMMAKLARERLEVCVKCQAMAEECLKEALTYAKVREAFGRTIGSFQHNAFKLAEMATEVDIGRTYLNTLSAEYIRGDDITTRVSMAKAWLGEMVNRVAYQAVQLHGGYGYMEEYRISRLFRDARSLSIFAGTTEIMKLIIARRLGLGPV